MPTVKRRNSGVVALYGALLAVNLGLLVLALLNLEDFRWWEICLRLLVVPVWGFALRSEMAKPKAEPVRG